MKEKLAIIVNPVSGLGRQKKIEKILRENIDHELFDYSVLYTEYRHHGTELAREAAERGVDCVVAVGGDGSVNDVVQGLRGSDVRLGIIPAGSGNGLARTLRLPLVPALAVRVLNQRYPMTIDSIDINGKWLSVNASGVGFDAYIARLMHAAKTRGLAAYTNLIVREYASYKNQDYTLTVDGRTFQRNAWLIAVANSQQYGNNLTVAPKAKLDDGLMDITILDRIPPDHLAITVPLAFTKLFDLSAHVEIMKAKELTIEGNLDKWCNIDGEGENIGKVIQFTMLPASLRLYGRDTKTPLRQLQPSLELIKSNILPK
ncbi:MAG: diacylglycerol kinase family lipid kinase [Bacteroidales bacterium]|nr:diacylglycerol kinase family lipid kinase [Bacteroidales bacterium]